MRKQKFKITKVLVIFNIMLYLIPNHTLKKLQNSSSTIQGILMTA